MRRSNAAGRKTRPEPIEYRTDRINGAMGAQRLTNDALAEKAGVAVATVSAIRNGASNIELPTLKKILDALGLTLHEVFEPKPETAEANQTPASAGSHV